MRFFFLFLLLVSAVFTEIIDVRIFQTTDVHGNIFPYRDPSTGKKIGSFASMVPILRERRSQGLPVMFFDCGDIIQGTYEDKMTSGELITRIMNDLSLGYTARTLGNHAFDYGLEVFSKIGNNVNFPIVVSNLESSVPGQLDFVRDHYIVESAGFRFGIFGLLTVGTPAAQFPENVAGVEFLPEKNYLLNMPGKLREQGADFVILLAHLGMYDDNRSSRADLLEIIKSLPNNGAANIDLIFDGHSHITRFEKMDKKNKKVKPTWLMQSAKYGEQLGELKLQLCTDSRSIVNVEAEFHDLDVTKNPEDEGFLRANRKDWVKALKISRKRVATTELGFILPHDRFHAFHKGLASFAVAKSFYDYGHENGVKVDFACAINRGVRYHLASSAGKISRADVHRVCPFENKLVFAKIKGSDLLEIIKTDGRRLTFYGLQFVMTAEEHKKKGVELDALEINLIHADGRREPLHADRIYTVAMQDYLAQASNFDFFKTLYEIQATGISDQDIFAWFLSELSKQRQAEGSRISVAEFTEISNRFLLLK